MFGLVARLLGGAISPLIDQVSETAARLARKVALLLLAALCMVIVVIALTVAFFLWLATVASPVVAALSVAGFYLTIAIVAVVLALWGSGRKAPAKETSAPETEATKAAEAARAGLEAQIDEVTAPLMALFAKFGLRREQLAVMAGASIAKQIGPIPLVGLAIVGGFLLGRMWKGWRALPEILAGLVTSGLFGFGGDAPEPDEAPTDKAA